MFRYFVDQVLEQFSNEFKGVKSWKFKNNAAPEGFGAVADEFGQKIEELDHNKRFETMLSEMKLQGRIGKRRIEEKGAEKMTSGELLKIKLREWHKKFMIAIDSIILTKVKEEVLSSSMKRINIQSTVYNFTGKPVSDEIMKSLKLGANFVTHTKMSREEARQKLNQELLMYLKRYRSIIEKEPEIPEFEVMRWLEVAIDTSEKVDVHQEFYSATLRSLAIGLGIGKRVNDGIKVDYKHFDKGGICLVEADKNVGICLINITNLLRADEEMVNELGGQICKFKTAEEVKKDIFEEIQQFENSMDENSSRFINQYYGERMEEYQQSELPFLKNRPKIHKLTSDQIKALDPASLKYRPVVDASRTPLNPHAKMLTEYIRDLIRRSEAKYFNGDSTFVKNGHQFASLFKDKELKSREPKYFAVADLSSAYTYVYLSNLKIAMKYLGKDLGIPQWKVELYERIAILVFTNSYLETTKGIFKLSTCLPMGLCCSGECMDIVLFLCEAIFLGKIEAKEVPGFLDQFEKYNLLVQENPGSSFMKYKRYRDDTFSLIRHVEGRNPKEEISNLGAVFLPDLDINVELTLFVGSFLDVVWFKKFGDDGYETMIKRKGLFPITFSHASSNMSSSVVKSILNGEILRHRRICSNKTLTQTNDECITKELMSRGYKEEFVRSKITERIRQIEKLYDKQLQPVGDKILPEGLVYGTKTIYDEEWFTHHKLMLILKNALPKGVK